MGTITNGNYLNLDATTNAYAATIPDTILSFGGIEFKEEDWKILRAMLDRAKQKYEVSKPAPKLEDAIAQAVKELSNGTD